MRSCFSPLERCFGGEDGVNDGLLWHADLKPHAFGEFSIAVVQANDVLEDHGQVLASPSVTYVGVYDGHGGPEASRFATSRLLPYLHKFVTEQGGLSDDVMKKAFDATEQEFMEHAKNSWLSQPQIASVGSCCLVGAISNGTIYVANLGDSRAVLGYRGNDGRTVVAERLTTDQNVGVDEVREEVIRLHPNDSNIVVFVRGAWRIKGIIQVSRAIGDIYLKTPEFSKDPLFQRMVSRLPLTRPVISAEPAVINRQLRTRDLFLIFASDGLWDLLSDDKAVEIVSKNPRAGIARRLVKTALSEAARRRKMKYEDLKQYGEGSRRQIHDDITVIVVYFDHHHQRGHSRSNAGTFYCTCPPVDVFPFNSD